MKCIEYPKLTQDSADAEIKGKLKHKIPTPFYVKMVIFETGYGTGHNVPKGSAYTEIWVWLFDGDAKECDPTDVRVIACWAILRFGDGTSFTVFETEHHGQKVWIFPSGGVKVSSDHFGMKVFSVNTGVKNWGSAKIWYTIDRRT